MIVATAQTTNVKGWEIRLAFALMVGIAAGFWGLMNLVSDPAPWSATRWLVYILGRYAVFGLVIGALVPRWWYLSLTAGWGALFLTLRSMSREFLTDLLLPVLASLLVAGLLGAVAVRCFERSR